MHITEWFGTNRNQARLLFLRSLFGVGGMIGGFTAFQLLELDYASCFRESVPIWASLFGWIFLKEKLDVIQIFIISFIMGGQFLVTRPTFLYDGGVYDWTFLEGMTLGITASMCASLAFVIIRKIKILHSRTPNYVIINWLLCGGIFLSYPLSVLSGMPFQVPHGMQVFGVCLVGSFGFVGQLLLTAGIGKECVGPVMSVRSSDIILMHLC